MIELALAGFNVGAVVQTPCEGFCMAAVQPVCE